MIKQLYDYFQIHKKDKDLDFPEYGYAEQKAAYLLSLDTDGGFLSLQMTDKKLNLPDSGVRTSGLSACYFYDNFKYLLGCVIDSKAKKIVYEVHQGGSDRFDLFMSQHQAVYDTTHCPQLQALLTFQNAWKNNTLDIKTFLEDAVNANKYRDGFIVIRVGGEYLHEQPRLMSYWSEIANKTSEFTGLCTITGKVGGLKELHGKIKGVRGTSAGGGALVSFNTASHVSYNATTAPISCGAEFGYRTTLNYFLTGNNENHRVYLGNDTAVLWTSRKKNNIITKVIHFLLNKNEEEEDTEVILKNALEAVRNGRMPELPTDDGPEDDRFCLAVLSGNNGRVYMRDFLEHSIKDIVERAHQHLKDIALDGKQVSLQSLAWACVGNGSNESPPKPVYRALLRSVIEGEQYPYQAVLTSLGLCLKPEGLRRNRVALIKGYLNRKYRNEGRKEFDVGLNEDATGIGYLLGRLLAVADDIQSASLGHGPNKSFSDRFRGALGATPGLVFHDIMNKVQAQRLTPAFKSVWTKSCQQSLKR
jgi:CRISPR-associated protein Csd1